MYSIFTYIFGWFMGQILFNISAPWFAFSACLDGHSLVLLHLLWPQRCFRWWSDHSGWVHQAGAVSQVEVSRSPEQWANQSRVGKRIFIYIYIWVYLCIYFYVCMYFFVLLNCLYVFICFNLYVCIYVTINIYIYRLQYIYIYIYIYIRYWHRCFCRATGGWA